MDFIWETAIRRMVSLSGFRAKALQVGTMSDSSVMYWVILLRRRRSISLWFSLEQRQMQSDVWRGCRPGTTNLCYDVCDHYFSLQAFDFCTLGPRLHLTATYVVF